MRIIARLLAVAMILTGIGVVNAPTAHAAGCSGRLIRHDPIGSVPYGYIDIYYDSSTGVNCARANATGKYWGISKYMLVELRANNESNGCRNHWAGCYDKDAGTFRYYAGPVKVYGRNSCIYWSAKIYSVSTGGVGHCG